jgi:hypothetical protein
MDWAVVVTGAVGLAGIGGTLLSAKMTGKSDAENLRTSISAEDRRARLAEKRRIYAGCVAAVTAYSDATVAANTPKMLLAEQRAELEHEVGRTRLAAQVAVSEVDLIAPPEVAMMAHRAVQAVLHASEARNEANIAVPIVSLTMVMRRDLGANDDSAGELVLMPAPPE